MTPLDHADTDETAHDGTDVPGAEVGGGDDGSEAWMSDLGDQGGGRDLEERAGDAEDTIDQMSRQQKGPVIPGDDPSADKSADVATEAREKGSGNL